MNRWIELCKNILDLSPFRRKKMAEDVRVLDDEMQSRYGKIHEYDGVGNEM